MIHFSRLARWMWLCRSAHWELKKIINKGPQIPKRCQCCWTDLHKRKSLRIIGFKTAQYSADRNEATMNHKKKQKILVKCRHQPSWMLRCIHIHRAVSRPRCRVKTKIWDKKFTEQSRSQRFKKKEKKKSQESEWVLKIIVVYKTQIWQDHQSVYRNTNTIRKNHQRTVLYTRHVQTTL